DENDAPDAVNLPKPVAKATQKPKPQTNQTVENRTVSNQPPAPPQPKPKAQMGTYTGGQGQGGNNQDGFNNVRNQGVAGGKGDQGKPNGNINSDNYTGNGGSGKSGVSVTRGLTGRRIVTFPSFEDDFNENAKIALTIKVDEAGRVVSAEYSALGSTSSKPNLISIAKRKAMQLRFNESDTEGNGTIVFNFRLKS
ncbi:MAG TPA: hypothetical protein PKD90_00505, partial [Phnomibacter sp.]|nr:hypothetical protein [Phnomibacter sp.]